MDRRDVLRSMISVGAYATLPSTVFADDRDNVYWYGTRPPQTNPNVPRFYDRYKPLKGISTLSKNVLLYRNLQREIGEIIPHSQSPVNGSPGEGDCVGHAAALGCDILAATDIHMLRQREMWVEKASVEMIYAGSRNEIGNGVLTGRGGSQGEWAAKYLRDYGVLHRLPYSIGENTINLTGYHPKRSRQYRDSGVPDWLESIAKDHPVREITRAATGKEALDAVCSGNVVIMCSSYAFPPNRDRDGFTTPYLSQRTKRGWNWIDVRVQWWHAMLLCGAILEGSRTGGTILNSHGDWNEGPQPHDLPDGGFNVELRYLDMMVKDWGDCWVLGNYQGHEAEKVRKHILYLR